MFSLYYIAGLYGISRFRGFEVCWVLFVPCELTCYFSEVTRLSQFLLLSFLLPALLLLPHNLRLSLDGSSPDDSLPQFGNLDQRDLGHLKSVLPLLHVRQVG